MRPSWLEVLLDLLKFYKGWKDWLQRQRVICFVLGWAIIGSGCYFLSYMVGLADLYRLDTIVGH